MPHSSEMLTSYNPLQRPTNLFHGAFGQFAKVLVCLTFSATQLSKQKYNSIITILALTTPQSSARLWSIKMSRSTIRVTLVRLVLAWPAAKGCSTKIKNAVPRKLFNQIRRRRQVSVWNVELSNVGVTTSSSSLSSSSLPSLIGRSIMTRAFDASGDYAMITQLSNLRFYHFWRKKLKWHFQANSLKGRGHGWTRRFFWAVCAICRVDRIEDSALLHV